MRYCSLQHFSVVDSGGLLVATYNVSLRLVNRDHCTAFRPCTTQGHDANHELKVICGDLLVVCLGISLDWWCGIHCFWTHPMVCLVVST